MTRSPYESNFLVPGHGLLVVLIAFLVLLVAVVVVVGVLVARTARTRTAQSGTGRDDEAPTGIG